MGVGHQRQEHWSHLDRDVVVWAVILDTSCEQGLWGAAVPENWKRKEKGEGVGQDRGRVWPVFALPIPVCQSEFQR